MRSPHAFVPRNPNQPWYKTVCRFCSEGPGASIHLYDLPIEIPEQDLILTAREIEPEMIICRVPDSQFGLFA